MKIQETKLQLISDQIESILGKTNELENKYANEISKVHPVYKKSALNLIHYLAFRNFDIDNLQTELRELGLPSLSNIESHVKRSLLSIKTIINHLQGNQVVEHEKGIMSIKKKQETIK